MLRAQRGGHLSAWALAVFLITTDLATGAPAKAPNPEVGGCTPIRTAAQLQAIKNDLAGNYCLMRDIDAGSIANFTPIGTVGNPFVGRFDGNGHVIRNLTIANSNPAVQYVGLFGDVGDAVIQDVGLVNADVSSEIAGHVGALIGVLFTPPGGVAPTVRRVFATGKVGCSGSNCTAGGLMGYASNSNIFDVWSSAAVRSSNAGGLVGQFNGNTLVRNSYATGDVTCENACNWIGGFSTQLNSGDLVRESFATGNV